MSIGVPVGSGRAAATVRAGAVEAAFARRLPDATPGSLLLAPRPDEVPVEAEYASFRLPHYATEDPPDWPERVVASLPSHRGALGDYLEHLPPGLRLARLLATIDVAEVDDFSLVEVVAAHKRMEAWSAAQAAAAAAELGRARGHEPHVARKPAGTDERRVRRR